MGIDLFTVFQEVYLRATNDPRVSNIVKFSDAIGELKVEVFLPSLCKLAMEPTISKAMFVFLAGKLPLLTCSSTGGGISERWKTDTIPV